MSSPARADTPVTAGLPEGVDQETTGGAMGSFGGRTGDFWGTNRGRSSAPSISISQYKTTNYEKTPSPKTNFRWPASRTPPRLAIQRVKTPCPPNPSPHLIHRLNQRPNMPIRKRKRLQATQIIRVIGDMIRHDHVRITHLPVRQHRLDHIHIPLVRIDLHKIVAMPANVSEVNIEDLLPLPEIPNDVEDFLPRFGEHLADRPLAEIQPVIRTLRNRHKLLQPLHRPQHRIHSLPPRHRRHGRIIRVARYADLVLIDRKST